MPRTKTNKATKTKSKKKRVAAEDGLHEEANPESVPPEGASTEEVGSDEELENLAAAAEQKLERDLKKQRRAEVYARGRGGEDKGGGKKKKKARWKNRKSVFVNQIPYAATQEQIEAHFADCGAKYEVRMVLNKKTSEFRGIAFVDFTEEGAWQNALNLDQSHMEVDGIKKLINVREAVAKTEEKKLTERQSTKKRSREQSKVAVDALIAKALEGGTVSLADFDERAIDFLCSVPEDVAATSIAEFASLELGGVKNRGAFFMGLLKRRLRGDTNSKIAARTGTVDPAGAKLGAAKNVGKGKGKGKGTGTGKGKGKGNGQSAGKGKGKGKGSGSGKGRPAKTTKGEQQKGGGRAKAKDWRFAAKDACYVCGKEGHMSRTCPQRNR